MLRPGRIERHIYIPPPDKAGRREVFKIHLRGKPLGYDAEDVKKAIEELKQELKDEKKLKALEKVKPEEFDIEKVPEEIKEELENKLRDILVTWLAEKTEGYTGADIEAVCREAGMLAIRGSIKPGMSKEEVKEIAKKIRITKKHFEEALKKVKPSLTKEDLKRYEAIVESFHKMYA